MEAEHTQEDTVLAASEVDKRMGTEPSMAAGTVVGTALGMLMNMEAEVVVEDMQEDTMWADGKQNREEASQIAACEFVRKGRELSAFQRYHAGARSFRE